MRDKVVVIGNIPVDRVVKKRKKKVVLQGYSPGGAINVAHYLKELIGRDQVLLVSNIGDDKYARKYIEPELKKMRDDYVKRVKDAETRLYEVDVTKPQEPKITRLKEAQKLMNTLYKNITPILPSVSTIYFQSCTPVFEMKYRSRNVELIRKAYEMKIPVILDWNKRKTVPSKKMEGKRREVLNMIDTLKMNESEAKLFVEPQTKKNVKRIKLRKRELERLADEIMDNYAIKRVVITLGGRGSYVQTRDMSLKFDALKPHVVLDATGTGDASSSAYCSERIKNLDEIETGVLSNILACLALETMFSYPRFVSRTCIRQYIKRRFKYCKKYKVGAMELVHKLGLETIS
jgi:sugar/nucleoside kinase (ribokinase family)